MGEAVTFFVGMVKEGLTRKAGREKREMGETLVTKGGMEERKWKKEECGNGRGRERRALWKEKKTPQRGHPRSGGQVFWPGEEQALCQRGRAQRGVGEDGTDRLRYFTGEDVGGFVKAKRDMADQEYVDFMRERFGGVERLVRNAE
jgi:hypothetical protein